MGWAPALTGQILLFVSFFLLSWGAHHNLSHHIDNRRSILVYQATTTLAIMCGSMLWCRVASPYLPTLAPCPIQTQLLQRLQHPALQPNTQHLLSAMLLGDKSQLATDVRQLFSRTGISHVLALSGMHIGVIVLLVGGLLPKGLPYRSWLLIAFTWAYIYIVGMPVSAIRAGIMLTIWFIHPFRGQQTLSLDVWALAALVMLIYNPYYLADIGFQLSFAAVGSIVLCQPFFFYTSYLPQKVQQWVWVCIAAQMGVMPLSIWYFGQISTLFLLSNALVTPILLPVVIYTGILFLLLSYLLPCGQELVGLLLNVAVSLLLQSVEWVDSLSSYTF